MKLFKGALLSSRGFIPIPLLVLTVIALAVPATIFLTHGRLDVRQTSTSKLYSKQVKGASDDPGIPACGNGVLDPGEVCDYTYFQNIQSKYEYEGSTSGGYSGYDVCVGPIVEGFKLCNKTCSGYNSYTNGVDNIPYSKYGLLGIGCSTICGASPHCNGRQPNDSCKQDDGTEGVCNNACSCQSATSATGSFHGTVTIKTNGVKVSNYGIYARNLNTNTEMTEVVKKDIPSNVGSTFSDSYSVFLPEGSYDVGMTVHGIPDRIAYLADGDCPHSRGSADNTCLVVVSNGGAIQNWSAELDPKNNSSPAEDRPSSSTEKPSPSGEQLLKNECENDDNNDHAFKCFSSACGSGSSPWSTSTTNAGVYSCAGSTVGPYCCRDTAKRPLITSTGSGGSSGASVPSIPSETGYCGDSTPTLGTLHPINGATCATTSTSSLTWVKRPTDSSGYDRYCDYNFKGQRYFYSCSSSSSKGPSPLPDSTDPCAKNGGVKYGTSPTALCGGKTYDSTSASKTKDQGNPYCGGKYQSKYECADGTFSDPVDISDQTVCSKDPWCPSGSTTTTPSPGATKGEACKGAPGVDASGNCPSTAPLCNNAPGITPECVAAGSKGNGQYCAKSEVCTSPLTCSSTSPGLATTCNASGGSTGGTQTTSPTPTGASLPTSDYCPIVDTDGQVNSCWDNPTTGPVGYVYKNSPLADQSCSDHSHTLNPYCWHHVASTSPTPTPAATLDVDCPVMDKDNKPNACADVNACPAGYVHNPVRAQADSDCTAARHDTPSWCCHQQ